MGWFNDFMKICKLINLELVPHNPINFNVFEKANRSYFERIVFSKVQSEVKLDLLRKLHVKYKPACFLEYNLPRQRIHVFIKLLIGVLKLQVELGRYKRIPHCERNMSNLSYLCRKFGNISYAPAQPLLFQGQITFNAGVIDFMHIKNLYDNNINTLIRYVNDIWSMRQKQLFS